MNRSPYYIYCLPTVKIGVRQLFITCLLPKVLFHTSFLNHYKRLNINNWFNLRLWALNIPRSTYLRQTQTRFLTHLPQPPALGQTSTGWLCCLPVGSWNQDFSLSLRPILKVSKRCSISFASNNWNSLKSRLLEWLGEICLLCQSQFVEHWFLRYTWYWLWLRD